MDKRYFNFWRIAKGYLIPFLYSLHKRLKITFKELNIIFLGNSKDETERPEYMEWIVVTAMKIITPKAKKLSKHATNNTDNVLKSGISEDERY